MIDKSLTTVTAGIDSNDPVLSHARTLGEAVQASLVRQAYGLCNDPFYRYSMGAQNHLGSPWGPRAISTMSSLLIVSG